MAKRGKTTDATDATDGKVVIRDIALPKSVTLPPWFTDPIGSGEREKRAAAARKPRPA